MAQSMRYSKLFRYPLYYRIAVYNVTEFRLGIDKLAGYAINATLELHHAFQMLQTAALDHSLLTSICK